MKENAQEKVRKNKIQQGGCDSTQGVLNSKQKKGGKVKRALLDRFARPEFG